MKHSNGEKEQPKRGALWKRIPRGLSRAIPQVLYIAFITALVINTAGFMQVFYLVLLVGAIGLSLYELLEYHRKETVRQTTNQVDVLVTNFQLNVANAMVTMSENMVKLSELNEDILELIQDVNDSNAKSVMVGLDAETCYAGLEALDKGKLLVVKENIQYVAEGYRKRQRNMIDAHGDALDVCEHLVELIDIRIAML